MRILLAALALPALWAADEAARAAEEKFIGARRSFWAFVKPERPAVPPLARNPVDAFLLEALREKKLDFAPPLDKAALLRRVTLDLTGLPPTRAAVDAFLADRSPLAYERVVDRLLASPAYGERWAQRWLDVVRYADTNGYEVDAERPHAWRYRDYVVKAFQTGKPFDRFVQEQIAGDELFPGDPDALIATGFHRAGPIHLVAGNQDEEMNRQEVLTEMTSGVSSVFLGLTVGCARCHNHKFDPILQADYYRLQGVFAATEGRDIEIADAAEKARYEEARKAHEALLQPLRDAIKAIEKPYREAIVAEKSAALTPAHRAALAKPKAERSPEEEMLAKEARELTEPLWDELVARIPEPERSRRAELRRQMHELDKQAPAPPATAYAVANLEKAPPTFILKGGDHRHKLNEVEAATPRVLPPAAIPPGPSGRRAALARWLTAPDHPLTARVMVNRIWQFRMGRGLVPTPNDFGALGKRPTNRKLLDWLATEFAAGGWSVRAIDRLIVTSRAYRQSATPSPAARTADPDNRLWSRALRKRMDAEQIRDAMLAVAGRLNSRMGGPPVRVAIEKEVYDLIFTEFEPDNLWPLPLDPEEQNRRSLYLLNKRTVRLPLLQNFDQPDAMTSCPERPVSTHALQALTMINSEFAQQQAAHWAAQLERECGSNRSCVVREAHRTALGRAPSEAELRLGLGFLGSGGAVADFALAMLNRNEFVHLP
jgi:hypothetical protein